MREEKFDFSKVTGLIAKYKYIFAILAVGIILMSVPSGETSKTEDKGNSADFRVSDFEKQVEKALASCEGVGRVRVVLSVDSGPESVYANEARKSTKEQENITESDMDTKPSKVSEGSGREVPLLIKEIYPEFRGAVIICDGAESISVKAEITSAVAALTGLTSDRISVLKMKNGGGKI